MEFIRSKTKAGYSAWSSVATVVLLSVIVCCFGCYQGSGKTFIDSLRSLNGERIIAIDQIDLSTRDGLPGAKVVRSAKSIKRIVSPTQIGAFTNALAKVTEGREFKNHPVAVGDCVFRVETAKGTWFIFCRVMQTSNGKTCVVSTGPKDQTNINDMKVYESNRLPAWLEENQIAVR